MAERMAIVNPSKAVIALVAMLCITVLMITNSIGSDAGLGLLGSIVGYAIGNGIAAASHAKVTPIIGERNTGDDT
jgi:hypothetical protein